MEQKQRISGTIVVFPVARRMALIRETVDILLKRHGKSADRFWHRALARLDAELVNSGLLDRAEIDRQIDAFASAVMRAIREEWRSEAGGTGL
ncbi:DUF6074 family protein [Oryzicola mucosus]|uniref:Uncharacterized protein n=1 Tax=Oryzicola mucosus TaxID=2767425 RepID=A0A8J6PK40_9HYPH|nr:hypothetical protein [Oryzicola mucosus]